MTPMGKFIFLWNSGKYLLSQSIFIQFLLYAGHFLDGERKEEKTKEVFGVRGSMNERSGPNSASLPHTFSFVG